MILPVPPQREQGSCVCIMPKGVRAVRVTLPRPLQSGQISGVVPSAQPVPLHLSQVSTFITSSSRLTPKQASSKLTCTSVRTFSPRMGAFGERCAPPKPPKPPPNPPPKPPPKRSFRMSAKPPKPSALDWKLDGSNAAKPYWSYFARLSASESTS